MVLTITREMTKEDIDRLLKKLPSSSLPEAANKPPIDMSKYANTLDWKGDIVETQRRMRDDRNYRY